MEPSISIRQKKETSADYTPIKRYKTADESARVSCPVRRLTTIMQDLGHQHIDLLKMDIEGGEYDVISDMLKQGIEIRKLLVEFHHCYPTISYARTRETVHNPLAAGFRVLHITKRTYEISFLHDRQQG